MANVLVGEPGDLSLRPARNVEHILVAARRNESDRVTGVSHQKIRGQRRPQNELLCFSEEVRGGAANLRAKCLQGVGGRLEQIIRASVDLAHVSASVALGQNAVGERPAHVDADPEISHWLPPP